ncbi:Aprataxin and PNK-like factor, partial [Eudyptula minor novaehollandiae]
NQEVDAEEGSTLHPVEMSCSPSLIEPACSNSEIQGTAKMRKNDATSRHLVPPDGNESEQSKSIQRKRMLPSWMLERDLLVQRISEPVMKGGSRMKKGQGRGESNMESLKSEVNVEQKKRLASEETIEDFEGEEQDQGKRSCLFIPENYDIVAFAETWWGDLRNWSAAVDGYKLFRSDRRGRRGGRVPLYIRECFDCLELNDGDSRVECLWIRIRGKASKADIVVGVCYRPPNQDEEADEIFYKQLAEQHVSYLHFSCFNGTVNSRYVFVFCRKNPIHFQQFSHPNDDDYHETEIVTQNNDDNRPECPYGTACYRKNPQHKLEYKHSAPPGKRAVEKDGDDDEPNEYDLNDSFIDDEEEECEPTDEDSDWEPSSEDKDNEDVETLLQEARGFVKTKK